MKDFFRRNLANFITALRIPFSLMMLSFDVFSRGYYLFFSLAGITDVIDGTIARKLGIKSSFGARLDSISDLVFYITACAMMLPYLLSEMRRELWVMLIAVLALRVLLYIFAFIKYRCYLSHHTYLNKATGVCIFFTIYLIPVLKDKAEIAIAMTIAVGILAVAEEIAIVAMTDKQENDVHTLIDVIARRKSNP